jgi:uncharacterized protein (TIGR03083 family)
MTDAADWTWAGPPSDLRPLYPRERAELTGLLRGLTAADWERPTVCPGWRVHDVVAHVAHDYLRKLSGSRDGYGMSGPRPGETLPVFLARANQDFVDTAAWWSPRLLIDLIEHLGPQLDELWAGRDLDRPGWTVSWADPDHDAPVWLDVAREYTEYWVHQQQVRDAVGRPGADDAELARPVTDTFVRAVPYTLRELTPAPGTAVHLRVTGPGGGDWTARRRPDTWAIDRGRPDGEPAAGVEISSDALWRVATRGIGVDATLRQAAITGDQALGAAVLHLVSIIR